MTTDDRKSDSDRVARELAALGEPSLAADEARWLAGSGAPGGDGNPIPSWPSGPTRPSLPSGPTRPSWPSSEHEDTAVVAAMFRLAEPIASVEPLSELDRHRVWRRMAGRIEDIGARRRRGSRRGGPGSPTYRVIMAAVAMAAGVALVTRLSPIAPGGAPSSEASSASRASVQALGTRARQGLEALDGPTDGARARSLADGYAQRMRSSSPSGPTPRIPSSPSGPTPRTKQEAGR